MNTGTGYSNQGERGEQATRQCMRAIHLTTAEVVRPHPITLVTQVPPPHTPQHSPFAPPPHQWHHLHHQCLVRQ